LEWFGGGGVVAVAWGFKNFYRVSCWDRRCTLLSENYD
jgi:hypothetical protein